MKSPTNTETLLRIPFSVIGRCSLVSTSHWQQGKRARMNLSVVTGGFQYDFYRITGGKTAALRVFAAGYWTDFQVISKKLDKSLKLIFS